MKNVAFKKSVGATLRGKSDEFALGRSRKRGGLEAQIRRHRKLTQRELTYLFRSMPSERYKPRRVTSSRNLTN